MDYAWFMGMWCENSMGYFWCCCISTVRRKTFALQNSQEEPLRAVPEAVPKPKPKGSPKMKPSSPPHRCLAEVNYPEDMRILCNCYKLMLFLYPDPPLFPTCKSSSNYTYIPLAECAFTSWFGLVTPSVRVIWWRWRERDTIWSTVSDMQMICRHLQ